jgi:hypothetical protein
VLAEQVPAAMTLRQTCTSCDGTGFVDVPTIQDKIAMHLMNAPDNGLALFPAEVHELGHALGLLPEHGSADAGPVQPG